jgi:hypothetical protein
MINLLLPVSNKGAEMKSCPFAPNNVSPYYNLG